MCASGCCKEPVEINLCGLEEAVWLWGNISHMWATGGYMGLHNMTYLRRLYYTWGLYYTCIWASGCCMRASGGFMGQLYAVSYSVLVHVAWGLLEALWKL